MSAPQSLENHAKREPFFLVLAILSLVLWIGAIRAALQEGIGESWWRAGAGMVLTGGLILTRRYSLKVQDRLIRLEEQIRYERLLKPELRTRAASLTLPQTIALRFASDGELPGLVERTLEENLSVLDIKKRIQVWRPDHQRV
jgi:hypothetical protein